MKSMKLIMSIVFAVSVIMMLPGCKKDIKQTPQTPITFKAGDVKINTMLEAFKTKMKSHLKDEELISKDSVVWYLEGCLNETYARAADSIKTMWEDSAFVEIHIREKMVLISDINNAYEYLVNEISKHYYSINEEKELVFVNIEIVSLKDESIVVEMKDYVAQRPGHPNPNYLPNFGPDDHWWWGEGAGKCDSYAGNNIGEDASTQLTAKANILGYGPGIYWMHTFTTDDIWPEMVPAPNPYGYADSRLYEHSGSNPPEIEDCLAPVQMNYYLTNLRIVGNLYKPTELFSVMHYDVRYDLIQKGVYPWGHYHIARISYGIPVSIGVPREILPFPHN